VGGGGGGGGGVLKPILLKSGSDLTRNFFIIFRCRDPKISLTLRSHVRLHFFLGRRDIHEYKEIT